MKKLIVLSFALLVSSLTFAQQNQPKADTTKVSAEFSIQDANTILSTISKSRDVISNSVSKLTPAESLSLLNQIKAVEDALTAQFKQSIEISEAKKRKKKAPDSPKK